MDPRLLRYYNEELRHLREMGAEFAQAFPKIASRLGIEGLEVTDPYVERLLEGFAFLAGRAPERLSVVPEARPVLDGLVTGTPGGAQLAAQCRFVGHGEGRVAGPPWPCALISTDAQHVRWGPCTSDQDPCRDSPHG